MKASSPKAKVVGYVIEHDGNLMGLGPDYEGNPKNETLWIGEVSLFATRPQATKAIQRTIKSRRKWLASRGSSADSFTQKYGYHIHRVVAA